MRRAAQPWMKTLRARSAHSGVLRKDRPKRFDGYFQVSY